MPEALILGAGVMGSAFSVPLCDSGCGVKLVGTHLDESIIETVKATGKHPRLGISLPAAVVPYTINELSDAMTEDVDLVVIGVSSAGVEWAARRLSATMKRSIPVLMLTKGLAVSGDGELVILPDRVSALLEVSNLGEIPVGAVGGPCIAGELAVRRHSGVAIGFRETHTLQSVRQLLNAPYYHHHGTDDLVGLEVCAALKNFFAIAVGAANGANPLPIVVPCHRVVGSDGNLCGYGGGLHIKVRLLALESLAGAGL